MRHDPALDRATVPVLLLSGWQDIFLDQTITQYRHLRGRGVDVAMTIGPWTHDQMVTKAAGGTAAETLAWLGTHLAGQPVAAAPSPGPGVHHRPGPAAAGWICRTGRRPTTAEVLTCSPADGWGPRRRRRRRVHVPLRPGRPHPDGGRASAVPAVGLPRRHRPGPARRRAEFHRRAAATAEVCVCGSPVVELDYETDNPALRCVRPDQRGRSRGDARAMSATDSAGSARSPDGPIRIELDPIAHRFSAGSRIRVLVAGGCHPRFARNLGTGEPAITASAWWRPPTPCDTAAPG